jgi:site-specific recombinase XerD
LIKGINMTEAISPIDQLDEEMRRRKLHLKTQSVYRMWIKRLDEFAPGKLDSMNVEVVQEFLGHLTKRERLARQTVHQATHAAVFFLKRIRKLDVSRADFNLPNRSEAVNPILVHSPEDVRKLLAAIKSPKHHLLLALTYGAGLELKELLDLRIRDIDFQNRRIELRRKSHRVSRTAILPEYIAATLPGYIEQARPSTWLFEQKPGVPITAQVAQRAFHRAAALAGIDKSQSLRSLRYAYVVHMQMYGVPLGVIGKYLGLSASTIQKWLRIGKSQLDVDFSPLDRLLASQGEEEVDTTALANIVGELTDSDEREYFLEAISCYRIKAFRAAVVLAWQAAVRRIHLECFSHSLNVLNTALQKHDQNAREIKSIDDLGVIKETTLLNIARDLGIFDKNVKGILVECLGLRNKCGHPGKYSPGPSKIAAYLEDLITYVMQRQPVVG